MKHLKILIFTIALFGCGSSSDPETASNNEQEQGKGDVFETEITECEVGSPWGAETTPELDSFIQSQATFTEADIEDLDEVTANQLFDAVVHLGFLEETERFDLLFFADDEGELQLLEIVIDDVAFDWVRFFAGDTEVGVIFDDGTSDVVVEISDGDLLTCETRPGPLMTDEPICSFDESWRAETSGELLDSVTSVEEMDVLDATLSRHKNQIIRAMVHLELIEENGDIFDALDAVDEERVTVHELEFADGERFDWIQAFAGDTEVGVVFDREGTLPIAEISDGDVLGCTTIVESE